MKSTLKYSFIAITTLTVLMSCKKEKSTTPTSPTNTTSGNIVGTWTWVELYQINDGNSTPTAGDKITMSSTATGRQITFATDGSYNSDWNFAQMGTPPAVNADNGLYVKNDSLILTSMVTGYFCRGKIYKLTANELWYRYANHNFNSYYEVRFVR